MNIQNDGTIQYNISLPVIHFYLEVNIMRTDFNNWNMTDFTITDV